MNREIKFRVWDKVNYMSKPFTLDSLMRKHIQFTSDCPVMQFTGLKDKNGKEIYEGDILRIVTESGRVESFICKWGLHRRDMASGWTVDIPSFSFVNSDGFPTFPIVENYLNGHDLDIIEIIGNIYEHPHLLNSDNKPNN